MKIAIIGGGIGGLTTALSLHAAGIQARVYEASAELRPLGVGINLLPHAVRELVELGLGEKLAATAIETKELIYANRFGQFIWQEPRGLDAGYQWPQFSIHRGQLQLLLYQAVRQRLGPENIRTGHRLVDFSQQGEQVRMQFAGPDGDARGEAGADLVIAADGIHSTVRAKFYPDEGPPKWNGCLLWRATTEAAPYLSGRSMVMAGHANQKFVCYPVDAGLEKRGRSLINWIAEIRYQPEQHWDREDWNRPGDIESFLPAFQDWQFGWLDVPAIIRGAEAVYEFPMVDRDPLPKWNHGRVTLLGDAAHPMYPIGSNGASQAIVDGRYLAYQIATKADPAAALAAYQNERLPATAKVVQANRGNGPETVMQTVHERAPDGFRDLNTVIAAEELEAAAKKYKLVAGFDQNQLNERQSYSVALD